MTYSGRIAYRLILALVATIAGASLARAGDMAEINVLGFSANGSVFAFEEYGVQDGSGFPYANRFYINTVNDSFVTGTPIRARIDDETASVAQARTSARQQGEQVISDAELGAHPGFVAGWNAVTELSADPHRIAVNPRPVMPAIDAPLEFRLDEIGVQAPAACENLGDIVGLRLLRIGTLPGQQTALLQEDDHIPQSRGCPLGYRIGGVVTYHPEGGQPVFALLIAVRGFGFEGPDHRWIAVTGRL